MRFSNFKTDSATFASFIIAEKRTSSESMSPTAAANLALAILAIRLPLLAVLATVQWRTSNQFASRERVTTRPVTPGVSSTELQKKAKDILLLGELRGGDVTVMKDLCRAPL